MRTPHNSIDPSALDDQALISSLRKVLSFERRATASLVEHLAEFDTRGLYRDAGYSSLFAYCVEALQMSEAESYARIHAARLTRRFPALLAHLRQGMLNLTTLQLLGPKLEEGNCDELCSAAAGLSKRKLEEMLAARFPQADLLESVRQVPMPQPACAVEVLPLLGDCSDRLAARPVVTPTARPAARAVVAPLSADRFKVQLTVSREQRDKLNTARDLLRHAQPDGDLARIIERGLDLLIDQQLKRRFGASNRPRKTKGAAPAPRSRHVPNEIRRGVLERDSLRCTFVSKEGKRCDERGWLELDHEKAYALGGQHTEGNVRMMCRAHNQLLAERVFGPLFMRQHRDALPGERSRS
jgi:5-methylcytosine-specific restriction endonuclease McrA